VRVTDDTSDGRRERAKEVDGEGCISEKSVRLRAYFLTSKAIENR
jgi:hypothetical protein